MLIVPEALRKSGPPLIDIEEEAGSSNLLIPDTSHVFYYDLETGPFRGMKNGLKKYGLTETFASGLVDNLTKGKKSPAMLYGWVTTNKKGLPEMAAPISKITSVLVYR